MATRQVALLPALLLATFISPSFEMIHPTASSQWTQWNETPAPPWHETPATGVKHPGGFCGNIAQEWEMLKTHVMSLRVESEALEHMRHRLHEMEEWVKGLDNRVNHCTCEGKGDDVSDQEKIDFLGDILKKSMMFYEAQRSGRLPTNNRIRWRRDSGLKDVGYDDEDLTGGWYEGGSDIKASLPMAHSVTILIAGILMGRHAYEETGQLGDMMDSVRWPLDYLLKCHVRYGAFYAQVGDPRLEEHTLIRPEDMKSERRPVFMVNETNPGSEVVGEAAAAMAAGYILFNRTDPAYANKLLDVSTQLYKFGHEVQGDYFDKTPEARGRYVSTDYKSSLAWGAMWLYEATKTPMYLENAMELVTTDVAWSFSWANKTVGVQLMIYNAKKDPVYRAPVEQFLRHWFDGGSIPRTPKGLAWRDNEGSIRHAANAAFVAGSAANFGILPNEGRKFIQSQLEYILGRFTGRSFMVGFGEKSPKQPRHAGATCQNESTVCDRSVLDRDLPNPHILTGALVGGPDIDDHYEDRRSNDDNRVSITFNAGFQSAVAIMMQHILVEQGKVPDHDYGRK